MVQQAFKQEEKINEFVADLNKLTKKHGLIIDEELQTSNIKVYTMDYELVGEIEYDEEAGSYQEKLSQTQKEIRAETNKDGDNDKQVLQKLLTGVENIQKEFIETVVDNVENEPKLVTEEEELIYWVALDKIDDVYDDGDLWFNIRYHPEDYTWNKIKDLHWEVIEEGEVILVITKEDVCCYVDEDILEQNYSEYL